MSDRMKMDEEKIKLIGKGITKALEKKFKTEYKEFVDRIIKELDEKLSSMSDEEREEYFKQMGFVTIKDDMPENIKERAQINKIIAKQKKKEYPNK